MLVLSLIRALSVLQQGREVVRGVRVAGVGGFAEPLLGLLHAVTVVQQGAEVSGGVEMAGVGGFAEALLGFVRAVRLIEDATEVVHGVPRVSGDLAATGLNARDNPLATKDASR